MSSNVKDVSSPLCVDTSTSRDHSIVSPCVSPPTCASPTSFKPTLIEDQEASGGHSNNVNSDDHFLCPASAGSQNHISTSGMSGTNTDIPVDKENPMRCVECGEEFVNHFRYFSKCNCVNVFKKCIYCDILLDCNIFWHYFQLKTTLPKRPFEANAQMQHRRL